MLLQKCHGGRRYGERGRAVLFQLSVIPRAAELLAPATVQGTWHVLSKRLLNTGTLPRGETIATQRPNLPSLQSPIEDQGRRGRSWWWIHDVSQELSLS